VPNGYKIMCEWELTSFHLQYVYDYMTKLCTQDAEVILNFNNKKFAIFERAKPDTENIRS
jgi:hypothetical protein